MQPARVDALAPTGSEQFRALVEQALLGVYLVNAEFRIVDATIALFHQL